MPFGGAGPMHAAAIAAELGIARILCPRGSGVLSALGLCASERRRDTTRTVLWSGEQLTAERIAAEVSSLARQAGQGLEGAQPEVVYEMRYRGQSFELPVPGPTEPDPTELAEGFAAAHEQRYGYRDPEGEVELVNIRVAMTVPGPQPEPTAAAAGSLRESARRALFDGEWIEARVLSGDPPAGLAGTGPLIFELPDATLVIPPGWSAEVDSAGTIRAGRSNDELRTADG
jgi:N-methylhydantoinase A